MMDILEKKKKIFQACWTAQLSKVQSLKNEVDEAQKSANEYGGPKDRYDSYRTQLLRKRDMFAQQLAQANEQLDVLRRVEPETILNQVEFGAVIITDMQNLFVSISLGKFLVDGEAYYAISAKVPIFNVLKGKKEGDIVAFNSNTFIIKSVF